MTTNTANTATTLADIVARFAANTHTTADVAAVADALAYVRANAANLPVAANPGDYAVVAMTGSGKAMPLATTAKTASWFAANGGTDVWALCYAVRGAKAGSYQATGCRWGHANSYAKAANDVAIKATTKRNGSFDLVDGSVFAAPAYIVAQADVQATTDALTVAYALWLSPPVAAAPVAPVAKPVARRATRGKVVTVA